MILVYWPIQNTETYIYIKTLFVHLWFGAIVSWMPQLFLVYFLSTLIFVLMIIHLMLMIIKLSRHFVSFSYSFIFYLYFANQNFEFPFHFVFLFSP